METSTTEVVNIQYQLRQGNKTKWETENPTLLSGEPGIAFEEIEGKAYYTIKIGDGTNSWNNLEGFNTSDIEKIKKYMEEHGGAWDAISLASDEENKEFIFQSNTQTLRHVTPDYEYPDRIAAGLIYNAGQGGSSSFEKGDDDMRVQGKNTFAAGRNIKVNANYASALGSHHVNEGYGAFAAGTGNILTTLKNNNGKTKNSQYAIACGQQVGTIGAASFSAGTGDSAISNFVQNLTASNSKAEVYNKWIALNRDKRPSISWGDWSARFGSYNISIGNNSFVAGGYNAAVGDCSAAFGTDTFALHDFSFVCGSYNLVDWKESFAAGSNNKVYDQRSFVVGGNNIAGIKGRCAEQEKEEEENNIPEGNRKIIGYNAVFGQNNSALSTHGFISGYNNTIAGAGTTHSGIVGMGNYIGSGGYYSFVAGLNNLLSNNGSTLFGSGLISSKNYGLTVGRLNAKNDKALFIVGNGSGDPRNCEIQNGEMIDPEGAERSNAFMVFEDGHAEIARDDINNPYCVPRMETLKPKFEQISDIQADLKTTKKQVEALKGFTTIESADGGWVITKVDDIITQATITVSSPWLPEDGSSWDGGTRIYKYPFNPIDIELFPESEFQLVISDASVVGIPLLPYTMGYMMYFYDNTGYAPEVNDGFEVTFTATLIRKSI